MTTTCNKPVRVGDQDYPCQSPAGHAHPCTATPWVDGPAGRPITSDTTDLELFITDDEIAMLTACQNETEWKNATVRIKEPRNGHYPRDWFARVIQSGLMKKISSSWGAPPPAIGLDFHAADGTLVDSVSIPVDPQDEPDKEPGQE